MKKIFAVAALLILTGSTFAQTKWAAEDMGKLIQAPMDSVRMCLKGAYHEVNQFKDDVYYIYSRRDKKNVPVIFRCGEGRDSVTRVWSVEFPSPVKSKGYKTASLREAFWFEHWKQELKKQYYGTE